MRGIPPKNNAKTQPEVKTTSSLNLGTWGLTSLYLAGKLNNLIHEMESRKDST